MSQRIRRLLVQAGSFVLAGLLLYMALRGVDFEAVAEAFRTADYRWLAPLVVIAMGSHVLRAWRWQVLLEALPPEPPHTASRLVSLKTSFYSVMIGYMVNYAAPRLGEVARTANLSAREKLRFSSVFGTVVVERALDVVVMGGALLVTLLLLFDRLAFLDEWFIGPLRVQLEHIPTGAWAALVGGLTALGALACWVYRRAMRQESSALRGFLQTSVQPALRSFKDGLLTLVRSPRRGVLACSTLGMWGCYLLMAYLPLHMFGMTTSYELGLSEAWILMTLGAIGVSIPTPGGIGSYHYITIQALVYLFGVPEAPAASYAVLVHAVQLVLYTLVGGLCLALQGTSLRALRQTARTAPDTAEEHAELPKGKDIRSNLPTAHERSADEK